MLQLQMLVEARLYPNLDAVIQDALRALLQEKPQLRVELALYRYQTEDISLAKAAHRPCPRRRRGGPVRGRLEFR